MIVEAPPAYHQPSETGLPTPPAFAMNNPATDTSSFYPPHHQRQMQVEEYPERPGEPECTYFLKTGDCKYRSNCKYHHPKTRIPKAPPCVLSDKGLPLRPVILSSFYSLFLFGIFFPFQKRCSIIS